jgi:hypothetical protein
MAQADGGDEMPDGVEIDAGRLDQLLASLVEGAAEARAYWSDAWDRHEATERFVGQPFAVEPMDELAGLMVELLGQAEAAYRLVDDATGDYWSRQPDEEDEEDPAED